MKKFFVVFLAVILVFSSFSVGYSVSGLRPISDVSYLSQFDVGNGNLVIPVDLVNLPSMSSGDKTTFNLLWDYYCSSKTSFYSFLFSNNYNDLCVSTGDFSFSEIIKSGSDTFLSFRNNTFSLTGSNTSYGALYFRYNSSKKCFDVLYDTRLGLYSRATGISSPNSRFPLSYSSNLNFCSTPLSSLSGYSDYSYAINAFSDLNSIKLVDSRSYTPPVKHTLTVNYLYSNGSSASASVVQFLSSGLEYRIPSPNIEGYITNTPLVSGVMPNKDLIINVTYNPVTYPLTIKFQYPDGTKALDDVVLQYPPGGKYDYLVPDIEGYEPDIPDVIGTMPAAPLEKVVTYSPIPRTLTINYLYSENNPAAESVTQVLGFGAQYSIDSPEIEGYFPSRSPVSGVMPNQDLTVNVYYSRSFYPLTIKYLYSDGSKAAEDVFLEYPLGFKYDIPSPEIEGYQPDKPTIAGEMPGEALEEVVTYSAIPYTLTVQYLFTDGSQAAPDHQEQLTIGSSYSVPSPVIEGYHPNQTAVTGIMPASDVVSTVTYREDSGGSSGPGSSGPGEGGDSGGGDPGGGDGSGDDPFIPVLPPFSGNDPFVIPGIPDFSGYDPFVISEPPGYSGYDPFRVPQLPRFSGYDPFKMPERGGS